ncbi:hypothetical protein M0R45_011850 [Rubus argutus]|uniref:Uncharacterized protein n=1 Tax=Rubus argutus TaxID=59490 RepID=A0AAW1YER4_RUBAR
MEESEGNKNNRPSSLPANYVTLLQLKERWLKEKEREQREKEEQEQKKEEEERLQREKEERERAQKEEEELRQQKLKEEEAKSRKPDGVVVVTNYTGRFNRREFRPVDRNVSECEGAQLEGKSEDRRRRRRRRRNGRRREKSRIGRKIIEQRTRRAKSKNGEEIEPKFRDLSLNGETEKGDDRLRRPIRRNAGAKEKIEAKVRDWVMKGDDRLRGPNSKEEIEPKVRDLSTERGEDRFTRRKGKNVGGKYETGLKIRDLSMNAETERGGDRPWRPRSFDHRGNGKTLDHKKEKLREGPGLAWVKKGEASDGNVGGVRARSILFLEFQCSRLDRTKALDLRCLSLKSFSGSTGTSLNASSLKSAGTGRVIQYRVSEANAN